MGKKRCKYKDGEENENCEYYTYQLDIVTKINKHIQVYENIL
jgi:hypothetical protein